ncbi:MAG TPA: curli assembly protein CsgF [Burkholderiaceae bacterium]|jgi:curli production assembly/transport component CsgF|nr:curli assembly protein CsgF [Burkholderiaceae bacterium]
MPYPRSNRLRAALLLTTASLAGQAVATEMVYYPRNPSFGGNPAYGNVLLNSAMATKTHRDPGLDDRSGLEDKSPLEQFNETLERQVVNRLTTAATSKIIGPNGNLIPGNLETDNFIINIADLGNGMLNVTTTDKLTGASTSFIVSSQ